MRKESKKLIVLAICAVVLVLDAIVALMLLTKPKQPGETLPETQAALSFSRTSGVYEEEFELTIAPADKKNVKNIYYTMDGSNPLTSDSRQEYVKSIPLVSRKNDANVLAAVAPGLFDSVNITVRKDKKGFDSVLSAPSDDVVDKCSVVKAAIEYNDGSFSEVITGTYFIGKIEEHILGVAESSKAQPLGNLAIISISMEYDDLFDAEKGIYVKGNLFEQSLKEYLKSNKKLDTETARHLLANYSSRGREWERAAHIDFFESNGSNTELVMSQDCGIRIQGNYSRSDYQKSFRLYARSEYGSKNFKYSVFGADSLDEKGETLEKYKTLILRNGGNCAFTTKYSSDFWQSLIGDMNVSVQNSRPCVVYINGEYWGLYVLEEDYTKDYFADHYGVKKDDVILYKGDAETYKYGYKLDLGDLPDGSSDERYYFKDLLNFFKTHKDCSKDADYEAFCKLVDPQSVIDYFAIELWINNKWDWPGKNWSMWKTKSVEENNPYADGRFRFCCYDMEFGGVSGASDASVNTVKEDNYMPNGMLDQNTSNPAVLCFAYLMTNKTARNAFIDKLNSLGENEFAYDKANAKLKEFQDSYTPLYDQFFNRYNNLGTAENSNEGGYASAKCIRDFLKQRAGNISKMVSWIKKYFGDK